MKTLMRVLAATAALLMLLTACAPKELTFVGETPQGLFRADEAVRQAYAEAEKDASFEYVGTIEGVNVRVKGWKGESPQPATAAVSPQGNRLTSTYYSVDPETLLVSVTKARYQKQNGDWYTYAVADGYETDEPLWLKLTDPSPANIGGEKALPAALAANDKVTLLLTMKDPTFYFTEDEENGVIWYLEAPLSVVFTDKNKRDSFRRQHPGGDAEDVGEEQYLWTARALLKLTGTALIYSSSQPDEIDFLLTNFTGTESFDVALGEDGTLISLTRRY